MKDPQEKYALFQPAENGIKAINTLLEHIPTLGVIVLDYTMNKEATGNSIHSLLEQFGVNINRNNIIIIDVEELATEFTSVTITEYKMMEMLVNTAKEQIQGKFAILSPLDLSKFSLEFRNTYRQKYYYIDINDNQLPENILQVIPRLGL